MKRIYYLPVLIFLAILTGTLLSENIEIKCEEVLCNSYPLLLFGSPLILIIFIDYLYDLIKEKSKQ